MEVQFNTTNSRKLYRASTWLELVAGEETDENLGTWCRAAAAAVAPPPSRRAERRERRLVKP